VSEPLLPQAAAVAVEAVEKVALGGPALVAEATLVATFVVTAVVIVNWYTSFWFPFTV
jgi:hypothetical protein